MTGEQKEEVAEELEKDSKVINLRDEPVRIYPNHCVNHGNCFQCRYVIGKILCAPAHRIAPTLTKEQKVAIARDAKDMGVKQVADREQIPMHLVRAWVGAYTRQSKANKARRTSQPGRGGTDDNQYCAICGRKLRLARRVSMEPGKYCSRCTSHVLPFLCKGVCPECKDPLNIDQNTHELVCHNCMQRWPALDETPAGDDQGSGLPAAENRDSPVDRQDSLPVATLQQRIDYLNGKISDLQQQLACIEMEITHYQSLLLHYEKVRDAEANGLSLQSTGDHNGQR